MTLKVEQVPPYQADDDQLPEPCHVEFCLKYRAVHGPDPSSATDNFRSNLPPEESNSRQKSDENDQRPRSENVEAEEGRQVEVRITWRSEQGLWATETLLTG